MPGRWLKEAYCTSSRIAEVSPEARDLWLRLVLKADDYGCFHGDAQLVASACFPRQPDAARCDRLLTELAAARLVERYNAAGQPYIAVTQWYERATPERRAALFDELFASVKEGVLKMKVERRYPLAEVSEALAHAQKAQRDGKILFSPPLDSSTNPPR